jgi:hypothetical protein
MTDTARCYTIFVKINRHDELFSMVLNDLHQDILRQSIAAWWIDNRKMSVGDLVRDYYLSRHSYYQFLVEGLLKGKADAIIEKVRTEGKAPVDINAEQAVLGAILIENDAYYLKHFWEDLHQRIFTIMRALIPRGEVVTPITIKKLFGDQDLGGITLAQYLAQLAAGAPGMSQVGEHVLKVYALSKYQSQMEAQK